MEGSTQVFNLMLQKVVLFAVKRDLNLQPWRVHERDYSCFCEEESPKHWNSAGRVGGPSNGITITEPEALQVLQLINFLKLQAHWPLNSIKPARTSVLRPCSFFHSVQCLREPGDLTSFPGRTAREVTARLPRFFPLSSPQVSFGLWNSKWLCYTVRNLCQNCIKIPLAILRSLPPAQGGRPVCTSPSSFDST